MPTPDGAAAALPAAGHALGPADAPATLHVFGTYECLHCRLAWPALRALADEGEARVVWHHFAPPGAFPHAAAAAAAAEGAAEQGAFWAAHDALMAASAPLWPEAAVGAVAPHVPDLSRWRHAMPGDAVRSRLAAQRDAAAALGVRGTPSVFLMTDAGAERVDVHDADALRARLAAGAAGAAA
jgi:protein-disulfide isomerase